MRIVSQQLVIRMLAAVQHLLELLRKRYESRAITAEERETLRDNLLMRILTGGGYDTYVSADYDQRLRNFGIDVRPGTPAASP